MPETDNHSRKRAVALAYSGERHDAPRVTAKGQGEIAERIIERAQQAGIFVHDSPELVALLLQVDLDDRIPETLYQVVAELLVWITSVDHDPWRETPADSAGSEQPRMSG